MKTLQLHREAGQGLGNVDKINFHIAREQSRNLLLKFGNNLPFGGTHQDGHHRTKRPMVLLLFFTLIVALLSAVVAFILTVFSVLS